MILRLKHGSRKPQDWQQPKRGQESREVQEESIFLLFKMGRQTRKDDFLKTDIFQVINNQITVPASSLNRPRLSIIPILGRRNTSNEKFSPTYGTVGNRTFVFEIKGRALVGIYGQAGFAMDAIWAYF
ncbi:hypothetical protein YC2023_041030 [Brassica napus]